MPESKLYIVPTPIGNLEDITFRAIRILKESQLILAEDTRTSGFLLKHFGIGTPMRSFHKFNEHQATELLVERIKAGQQLALISDAGTPGISDPGFFLVRACVQAGIAVECLPGATAFVPALVVSGFPTDKFVFEGFLPQKKGRQTRIKLLAEEERTIVLYESPHRIAKALEQLMAFFEPDRPACLCRELSKKFEEILRGNLKDLHGICTQRALKGEMVLVIQGKNKKHESGATDQASK